MTKSKSKINLLYISSSRADYGIVRLFLKKINSSNRFNLKLIVTGSHLEINKGFTISEIINDKFNIFGKIKINSNFYNDESSSVTKILSKFSSMINLAKPDIILLLGDRKEIFISAIASFNSNIKIIHISGGEKTIGSKDDIHRHLISKMSDYHFTSTSIYKKRLVQLGENKSNIFMTGSLATDNIHNLKLKSKRDLEKLFNFNFASKNILISFHPDTSVSNYDAHDFEILLKSLKKIKNTLLIFTYPNSDKGSDIIINKINNFKKNNQNSFVIKSLGQVNYFSLVKYIDFFVGNSSSGITEIPLFKKLTINIGRRQNGRLMSSSVITLPAKVKTIDKTLNMALSDKYRISHDKIYFKTKGATKKMYNLLFKIYNYKKKLKIFEDIK